VLIDRNDLPKHFFGIPDLDLSEDLCAEPLAGPWFRRDGRSCDSIAWRQVFASDPPKIRPARDPSGSEWVTSWDFLFTFRQRLHALLLSNH
jgi:hypothetical protein